MKTNLLKILALVVAKTKGMKCVFFLVSLFSLLLAPQHAQADEYTVGKHFKYDGFEYVVKDPDARTLSVYGCDKTESSITIPDVIHPSLDQTWSVVEVAGDWNATSSWSSSITSVIIPNTVTKLGSYCFNGASMKTICLSNNIDTIAPEAFLYLGKNMTAFSINGNSSHFKVDDGILYTFDGTELVGVPSNKTFPHDAFEVPEGVVIIRTNAFANNQQIATIHLPTTCTKLEKENAHGIAPWAVKLKEFTVAEGNTVLEAENGVLYDKNEAALVMFPPQNTYYGTGFTVPGRIKKIYSYGFFYCPTLTYIKLNQVNTLERRSIYQLSELKTLTLSSALTTIEEDAISDNTSVIQYIVDNNPNYIAIEDAIYSADGKTLLYFPAGKRGSYVFPSNTEVETLGRLCFSTSHLSSLKIPKSVKKIDDSAIFNMSLLETLTFEESSGLETIEAHGIYHNKSLTQLVLPKTLQEIKYQGIADNIKLKEVIIPNGSELINIHQMAFWNDTNLEHVTFEGSCKLENIGEQAFYGCNNLENFNMPASVKYIGNLAFGDCSALETVTFPSNAEISTIGNGAFSTSGIQYINLPPSLREIESEAFRECLALHTVNVSVNANKISPEAFKKCENLTAINVTKANQTYSSLDGILLTKNKETLVTFPAGKGYENFTLLPPSLKTIGDYAFYDCKKLKNVVIPNKVTSIGQRAFGLCPELKTVTFLCDEMIDPDNIVKGLNRSSFDDDVLTNNPGDDTRGNITLNVRKELLNTYTATPYYQNFGGIQPSFVLEKENGDEEYIAVSENKVDLLDTRNADYTYIIPKTVPNPNYDGSNAENYTVAMVGDYAFQNNTSDVKEVVIFDNLEYIGAKAFMNDIENNTSTIENVFFIGENPTADMLSTKHFDLDDTGNNYNEFAASTNIYVKKSVSGNYGQAWTKKVYNSVTGADDTVSPYDYTSRISYKIPGIDIANRYGTFSREFDVDLAACPDEVGNGHVYAFVIPTDGIQKGTGDYGVTEYHVQMHSINEPENPEDDIPGKNGNGTYIPAGTGVLLCAYDTNQTVSNDENSDNYFFYTIGENDVNEATESVMQPITVNPKEVTDTNHDIYVMAASGVYKPLNGKTVKIPIHKSYLQIPGANGAKVVFDIYMPDGEVTTIDSTRIFDDDTVSGKTVYDLQGRKLSSDRALKKGIYIVNGKKVILK